MYREKKIYSGDMLEIEIYPISEMERRQPRKKKEKESAPKQKNLNDKNAKKHLIRLINNNFTDDDVSITLTYRNKDIPESEEEAKKDVSNYLRRLKHHRIKNKLPPLKYIAVIEYKEPEAGKRGVRIHHHIIINGMDRDIVEQLWTKGRANADRLKADDYGYEGLARYITKDPKGSKRWTQSKNLKQPTVKVNDFKYTKRKAEKLANAPDDSIQIEKLYQGYILNECKTSFNEINACTYISIKMRKIPGFRKKTRHPTKKRERDN